MDFFTFKLKKKGKVKNYKNLNKDKTRDLAWKIWSCTKDIRHTQRHTISTMSHFSLEAFKKKHMNLVNKQTC